MRVWLHGWTKEEAKKKEYSKSVTKENKNLYPSNDHSIQYRVSSPLRAILNWQQ